MRILAMLVLVCTFLGCKPKQPAVVKTTDKIEVRITGTVTDWTIQDVSKTTSAVNERTYLSVDVESAVCPEDPECEIGFSEFSLNRRTKPADREIQQGDKVEMVLTVDRLPQPDYIQVTSVRKLP